jgi:hypothetical protein
LDVKVKPDSSGSSPRMTMETERAGVANWLRSVNFFMKAVISMAYAHRFDAALGHFSALIRPPPPKFVAQLAMGRFSVKMAAH